LITLNYWNYLPNGKVEQGGHYDGDDRVEPLDEDEKEQPREEEPHQVLGARFKVVQRVTRFDRLAVLQHDANDVDDNAQRDDGVANDHKVIRQPRLACNLC
jgi:hypothetical protein